MMTLSLTEAQRAAAPFKQIIPLPRSPAMVYVSNNSCAHLFNIYNLNFSHIPQNTAQHFQKTPHHNGDTSSHNQAQPVSNSCTV